MKKIIASLTIVACSIVSYGQGFVNFANGSTQLVTTNASLDIFGNSTGNSGTGSTTGSTTAPQGYFYALLMQSYSGTGPTVATTIGTLLTTGWTFTGAYGTNALGAGRFGGGATAPTTTADTVGSANQFIIVGWSSSLGTNWSTVSTELLNSTWQAAGYFGISSVGTGVGQANTSPETLFATSGTAIQSGFSLYAVPVPEPGTMALAALGGASLLLFRRRKV